MIIDDACNETEASRDTCEEIAACYPSGIAAEPKVIRATFAGFG